MRKKGNKLIEFVSKIMAFVMAVTLLSSLPVQNVLANESKETKEKSMKSIQFLKV